MEGILTSERRHFHLQKGGSEVEVKRGTSTLGNIDAHMVFRRFGGGGSQKYFFTRVNDFGIRG